jgi:hypothetical protein
LIFVCSLGVAPRLFAYRAFAARDGSPALTTAALRDEWKNRETGERSKSCTMIIIAINDFAAEHHAHV